MDTIELIYSLDEIFSKSIPNCKLTERTDKLDGLIEKFFCKFEKDGIHRDSMGVTFLYDYFCYAYQCMTGFGEDLRPVPLNWVIGMPQYKRWKDKPESYHFLIQEGILSHIKLAPLSELKTQFRGKPSDTIDVSQENERRRFHNTAEGFINCILSTTMCDNRSEWCQRCNRREDCIEELKIRDSSTALRRGFIKL